MIKEDPNNVNKKKTEEILGVNFPEITISGYVMVTKNPCSHPGDIRLLKAVGADDERYE